MASRGLLDRVRLLFLVFAELNVVGSLPVVLGARGVPRHVTLLALAALGYLAVTWLLGYRRGRFPWAADLPDAVALFVVGVAAGEPTRVLNLLYLGVYFRSLYGSGSLAALRSVLYAGGHFAAVAATGHPSGGVLAPEVLSQAFGVPVSAGVMSLLAHLTERHQETARRDLVLSGAATDLLAATTAAEAHRVALEAGCQLAGTGDAHALVVIETEEAGLMRVVAGAGAAAAPFVGRDLPHSALPPAYLAGYQARRVQRVERVDREFRRGLGRDDTDDPGAVAAPLVVGEDLRGVLVVGAPSLPAGIEDAVALLASQLSLSLRRFGLAAELQAREERFRSLVEHTGDLILVATRDWRVTYASDSVQRLLGHDPRRLVGGDGRRYVHPEDRFTLESQMAAALARPGSTAQAEIRFRRADGTWAHFEASFTNLLDLPSVRGVVVNAHDVTERRALEARLRHEALHDPLTGLANRALFVDRLEHALARSRRTRTLLAVLFVDLDDFKAVNDGAGHGAGDAVLRHVARVLAAATREGDTVARLGGDEFAVLAEDVANHDQALALGTRVLQALDEPVTVGDDDARPAASIGIVVDGGSAAGAVSLLRDADVAMYHAKALGKGRLQVFEAGMREAVQERLALKADLARAIDERELEVHYQPVVRLDGREVVAVEALARWRHPERGLLAPGAFVPLAEETGSIVPIGRQVLVEACQQVAAWRARVPELVCAVNLSVVQLQDPGLVADVEAALAEAGLPPGALAIEVTETALAADTDLAAATLARLKALGVRLALDDFGTGYSSLTYLRRFPLDGLKIDGSFVATITADTADARLAAALINLGRFLGLEVVAEGIENAEQVEQLQALGCRLGQGHHLGRPLPAPEADLVIGRGSEDTLARPDEVSRVGLLAASTPARDI